MTTRRVAIIGGGYSGLSLANFLQKHGYKHVTVIEALHELSKGTLYSNIVVPSAKKVYEALDWKWEFNSDSIVSEEKLLLRLRRDLTILYRHTVYDIQQGSNGTLFCLVRDSGTTSTRNKNDQCRSTSGASLGPFDLVVIANGVRSTLLSEMTTTAAAGRTATDNIFIVGDARSYRFWDFGRKRILSGANNALSDGIELGVKLVVSGGTESQQKFSASLKQRNMIQKRILVRLVAFVAVVVWFMDKLPFPFAFFDQTKEEL